MTLRPLLPLPVALLLAIACSDGTDTGSRDTGPSRDTGGSADLGGSQDFGTATCGTAAYLPASAAVGDFAQSGAYKAAQTPKQLQALINGGSDKYEKNKFLCMVLATYASATQSHGIEVWLFDQTDTAGAQAAYTATKNPDDTATSPVVGDESRENLKLLFEYTADMRKGRYLARVKIDDKKGAADGPKMLKAIADKLP